ncbi:hypothetical protein HDV05_005574 [Chytridiales sp. JEL 0842]|nr:hypothetical protein HDV05_005574 [Chytridiales sp. JEL 0842]
MSSSKKVKKSADHDPTSQSTGKNADRKRKRKERKKLRQLEKNSKGLVSETPNTTASAKDAVEIPTLQPSVSSLSSSTIASVSASLPTPPRIEQQREESNIQNSSSNAPNSLLTCPRKSASHGGGYLDSVTGLSTPPPSFVPARPVQCAFTFDTTTDVSKLNLHSLIQNTISTLVEGDTAQSTKRVTVSIVIETSVSNNTGVPTEFVQPNISAFSNNATHVNAQMTSAAQSNRKKDKGGSVSFEDPQLTVSVSRLEQVTQPLPPSSENSRLSSYPINVARNSTSKGPQMLDSQPVKPSRSSQPTRQSRSAYNSYLQEQYSQAIQNQKIERAAKRCVTVNSAPVERDLPEDPIQSQTQPSAPPKPVTALPLSAQPCDTFYGTASKSSRIARSLGLIAKGGKQATKSVSTAKADISDAQADDKSKASVGKENPIAEGGRRQTEPVIYTDLSVDSSKATDTISASKDHTLQSASKNPAKALADASSVLEYSDSDSVIWVPSTAPENYQPAQRVEQQGTEDIFTDEEYVPSTQLKAAENEVDEIEEEDDDMDEADERTEERGDKKDGDETGTDVEHEARIEGGSCRSENDDGRRDFSDDGGAGGAADGRHEGGSAGDGGVGGGVANAGNRVEKHSGKAGGGNVDNDKNEAQQDQHTTQSESSSDYSDEEFPEIEIIFGNADIDLPVSERFDSQEPIFFSPINQTLPSQLDKLQASAERKKKGGQRRDALYEHDAQWWMDYESFDVSSTNAGSDAELFSADVEETFYKGKGPSEDFALTFDQEAIAISPSNVSSQRSAKFTFNIATNPSALEPGTPRRRHTALLPSPPETLRSHEGVESTQAAFSSPESSTKWSIGGANTAQSSASGTQQSPPPPGLAGHFPSPPGTLDAGDKQLAGTNSGVVEIQKRKRQRRKKKVKKSNVDGNVGEKYYIKRETVERPTYLGTNESSWSNSASKKKAKGVPIRIPIDTETPLSELLFQALSSPKKSRQATPGPKPSLDDDHDGFGDSADGADDESLATHSDDAAFSVEEGNQRSLNVPFSKIQFAEVAATQLKNFLDTNPGVTQWKRKRKMDDSEYEYEITCKRVRLGPTLNITNEGKRYLQSLRQGLHLSESEDLDSDNDEEMIDLRLSSGDWKDRASKELNRDWVLWRQRLYCGGYEPLKCKTACGGTYPICGDFTCDFINSNGKRRNPETAYKHHCGVFIDVQTRAKSMDKIIVMIHIPKDSHPGAKSAEETLPLHNPHRPWSDYIITQFLKLKELLNSFKVPSTPPSSSDCFIPSTPMSTFNPRELLKIQRACHFQASGRSESVEPTPAEVKKLGRYIESLRWKRIQQLVGLLSDDVPLEWNHETRKPSTLLDKWHSVWLALKAYICSHPVKATGKVNCFSMGWLSELETDADVWPYVLLLDPRFQGLEVLPERFVFDIRYTHKSRFKKSNKKNNDSENDDEEGLKEAVNDDKKPPPSGALAVGILLTRENWMHANPSTDDTHSKFVIVGIVIAPASHPTSQPAFEFKESFLSKAMGDALLNLRCARSSPSFPSPNEGSEDHVVSIITVDTNPDVAEGFLDARRSLRKRDKGAHEDIRLGVQISYFHLVDSVLKACWKVGVVNLNKKALKMDEWKEEACGKKRATKEVIEGQQKKVLDVFRRICTESTNNDKLRRRIRRGTKELKTLGLASYQVGYLTNHLTSLFKDLQSQDRVNVCTSLMTDRSPMRKSTQSGNFTGFQSSSVAEGHHQMLSWVFKAAGKSNQTRIDLVLDVVQWVVGVGLEDVVVDG